MSWDFKNNPVLRTLRVVIIGIFAFCLLFNSFTGGGETMGGHMDNMGMSGGYGFSLGGLIGGLLTLLVKLLMVALIIAVIVGIIVWVRNNFFQNTNSKLMQSIKNDPILKTITVVTLAIIGIVLIFALLGSFSQPGMMFGGSMGNFSFGYNPMYSIAGLLTLLVRVLMFILIVSLIMAAIVYLKNQYNQGKFNFLGNKAANTAGTGTANNQQPADNANNQQPGNNTGTG